MLESGVVPLCITGLLSFSAALNFRSNVSELPLLDQLNHHESTPSKWSKSTPKKSRKEGQKDQKTSSSSLILKRLEKQLRGTSLVQDSDMVLLSIKDTWPCIRLPCFIPHRLATTYQTRQRLLSC